MCLLRGKSEGTGHFFKGLLVPSRRKWKTSGKGVLEVQIKRCFSSFLLLSFLIISLLLGCGAGPGKPGPKEGTEPGSGKGGTSIDTDGGERDLKWWYFDRKGRLISRRDPENIPPAPFRPWTQQIRITGFCQIGELVIAVVNTQGLYHITPPELSKNEETARGPVPLPMWQLYRKTDYFGQYTAGPPMAYKDRIIVHLYRDSVLRSPAKENSENESYTSHSILSLDPGKGEISSLFSTSPFRTGAQQSLLSDLGHCVDILPAEGAWISAWKNITPEEIVFKYRSIDPSTGKLIRLTREQYREVVRPTPLKAESTPVLVLSLFESWNKARLSEEEDNVIYDIELYKPNEEGPRVFRSGEESLLLKGEGRIVKIPMLLRKGMGSGKDGKTTETEILGLFPDNTLRILSNGKEKLIHLPNPGPERAYTQFWAIGSSLMIAWERVRFTETAEAGVLEVQFEP